MQAIAARDNSGVRFMLGTLTVAIIAAMSGIAKADNSPAEREFDRRVYVGVGAGVSRIKPDPRSSDYEVTDDSDVAGTAFIGYDISKRLSVEAHASDLGEAGMASPTLADGTIGYREYGASLIGYVYNSRDAADYADGFDDEGYYRREGLSLYGRIGASTQDNQSDLINYEQENDFQLHLGAGAEYGFANGLAVRAEVTSFDKDAQMANISLLKRFGDANPYILAAAPAVIPSTRPSEPAAAPVLAPPQLQLPIVHFEFDHATLTDEARGILGGLVQDLQPRPEVRIGIQGHTDSRGSEAYNQRLSDERAATVKHYLEQQGVASDRMETSGYGETRPVDDNTTDAGRANNRRVEIIRIDQ